MLKNCTIIVNYKFIIKRIASYYAQFLLSYSFSSFRKTKQLPSHQELYDLVQVSSSSKESELQESHRLQQHDFWAKRNDLHLSYAKFYTKNNQICYCNDGFAQGAPSSSYNQS